MDVEMKCLLQEGFDLWDEVERLKLGKVASGVDKGTRMSTVAVRPSFCLTGVQTDGVDCQRGVRALLAAAQGLRVGECSV